MVGGLRRMERLQGSGALAGAGVSPCAVFCVRQSGAGSAQGCAPTYLPLTSPPFHPSHPGQVTKNHFASEFVFHKYRDEKTCGVIEVSACIPPNPTREVMGLCSTKCRDEKTCGVIEVGYLPKIKLL